MICLTREWIKSRAIMCQKIIGSLHQTWIGIILPKMIVRSATWRKQTLRLNLVKICSFNSATLLQPFVTIKEDERERGGKFKVWKPIFVINWNVLFWKVPFFFFFLESRNFLTQLSLVLSFHWLNFWLKRLSKKMTKNLFESLFLILMKRGVGVEEEEEDVMIVYTDLVNR